MNRQLETALNAATGTAPAPIADLTAAPIRNVERTNNHTASNDAPKDKPIKAVDALALCMRDSALGG